MPCVSREDIVIFVKLPKWFKVETQVGTYNPDGAIVKGDKIRCGVKHFEALGVDYVYAVSGDEV